MDQEGQQVVQQRADVVDQRHGLEALHHGAHAAQVAEGSAAQTNNALWKLRIYFNRYLKIFGICHHLLLFLINGLYENLGDYVKNDLNAWI